MTRPVDFSVLDTLRTSASRGQHAHVIQETLAIDIELQDLQLHLLDLRARSYTTCAQFANALETAAKIQQINPASALGYLCQAYIHVEQGRYMAASHVYDNALERLHKGDPMYDTIQTAKHVAMQQEEKRKDFICDIPMDISDRIIQHLFTDEDYDQQREYIMVSGAWWRRILASNYLAYTMRPGAALDETNDMAIRSFDYTRSLTLKLSKRPLGDLFTKRRFTRLTTLSIYSQTSDDHDASISALECIGTQLTTLILSCEGHRLHPHPSKTRLRHILATCPNLVSLHCSATTDITSINEVYPKLRELKLYKVQGTVDRQHMMTIREHLPGLKTMDMAITGSPTPLLFDDSWLPCIRLLAYGDLPDTSHLDYFGDRKGLVSFSIIDATYAFPLDDIAPLIIYHHETLQLLAFRTLLNTTNARKLMDAMHKDQDIEFKQLKILQVFTLLGQYEIDAIHSFCNFIHWVIERAPFLHTVELKGFVLCRSSLEALAKCIHLRHVDFRVPGIQRPEDYDTLVAEFLRDHVDYMADKGGSRLESVQVQLYEAMPTLINAIQGLKCLTSFHLTTTGLESERFKQLFDSLYQGCPGLQTLFIWTRGAIPNPVLYQIGGLSNLRFLTMVGDLKDSQAGVLSLQRCRHLERIIHYRPIDDDIRSMLLKSNPQLVISSP